MCLHTNGQAFGWGKGVEKLVQGNLVCNLSGGVLLELEPALRGLEQRVHLAPGCEVGPVSQAKDLRCHLTGGEATTE